MCSHDPIFRTSKESSIWRQHDHRDTVQTLSTPFMFQEVIMTFYKLTTSQFMVVQHISEKFLQDALGHRLSIVIRVATLLRN